MVSRSSVGVALVDALPMYRLGLEQLCAHDSRLALVGSYSSAREALQAARTVRPDVWVVDVEMADMRGAALLEALDATPAAARALVLTAREEGRFVHQLIAAGAIGFLPRTSDGEAIAAAILRASVGEATISRALQHRVAAQIRSEAARGAVGLTPREREVMSLVAQGLSAPEIGCRLYVSQSTVKTHLGHLYEKLGVSDRAAAVAQAMKRGLVDVA